MYTYFIYGVEQHNTVKPKKQLSYLSMDKIVCFIVSLFKAQEDELTVYR